LWRSGARQPRDQLNEEKIWTQRKRKGGEEKEREPVAKIHKKKDDKLQR
jgi:hypothetical protein